MVSPKIFSAVALVVDREDRCLASRRGLLPGTEVRVGESPEEVLLRSLRDDVGLLASRRATRFIFMGEDAEGRLRAAFDVSKYKGLPKEGWVWQHPARLVEDENPSRAFNEALFESRGLNLEEPEPEIPEPMGLPFEEALEELTGLVRYPRQHITYLYGPSALEFCPEVSILQPRHTFDHAQFKPLLLGADVMGIRTLTQKSPIPLSLFRYLHRIGPKGAAVVAVSSHRPTFDWERVSSNVIECVTHDSGARLTLKKNLAVKDKPVGLSVLVDDSLQFDLV